VYTQLVEKKGMGPMKKFIAPEGNETEKAVGDKRNPSESSVTRFIIINPCVFVFGLRRFKFFRVYLILN